LNADSQRLKISFIFFKDTMAKKICKDCPQKEKEEIKATEKKVVKRYSFPSL